MISLYNPNIYLFTYLLNENACLMFFFVRGDKTKTDDKLEMEFNQYISRLVSSTLSAIDK